MALSHCRLQSVSMQSDTASLVILTLLDASVRNTEILSCQFVFLIRSVFRSVFLGGARLSPLGTWATLWPLLYQPRMMDGDECGVVGEMSGRVNLSGPLTSLLAMQTIKMFMSQDRRGFLSLLFFVA
jgi:hypothetical protein